MVDFIYHINNFSALCVVFQMVNLLHFENIKFTIKKVCIMLLSLAN